ncbi:hypothetical protein JKP88DRAFT_279161 [Tribonema minus]|uniref:Uncharacterized protein n=1 Tax=Tribonema minus TaxID=303371 RepID=A0A835YVT6_9STRA|nr:hypothetical protein JKP88DRAFT_279161 [Tribonema minus]
MAPVYAAGAGAREAAVDAAAGADRGDGTRRRRRPCGSPAFAALAAPSPAPTRRLRRVMRFSRGAALLVTLNRAWRAGVLATAAFTSRAAASSASFRRCSARFEAVCLYTGAPLGVAYSREHVVPVSHTRGTAAAKDLQNVFPADRTVNSIRSNFRFVRLAGRRGAGGRADDGWWVDAKSGLFFPPRRARGAIARACLHVRLVHGVDVLERTIDADALRAWAALPLSDYERRHHEAAVAMGAEPNEFVAMLLLR